MNIFETYAGFRAKGSRFYTATRTYMHPDSGKTVVLVGTIHVGETKYYTELRELIAFAERKHKAQVHFERISQAPPSHLMLDSERAVLEELRELKTHRFLADLLQLPFQMDVLKPEEHWLNTDMTDLELIRAHPGRDFVKSFRDFRDAVEVLDAKQRERLRQVLHWALRHPGALSAFTLLTKPVSLLTGNKGMNQEIIINHRNRIAFNSALSAPGNVVSVWGAGHLPGLHKLYTAYGFSMIAETWHLAMDETVEDD